jgi:hypothetical protein
MVELRPVDRVAPPPYHFTPETEEMDARRLREVFDALDTHLEHQTVLLLRGGAAVLALGLEQRVTEDIDVLPESSFVESDLRCACERAGLGFNPTEKELVDRDYLEVVPEETLVLPARSDEAPYNTVYRGRRLTVQTPPAADLVVGKLKRLEPEDLADVAFLVRRFSLTREAIEGAFNRLPERHSNDPVVRDNLRYLSEDYL